MDKSNASQLIDDVIEDIMERPILQEKTPEELMYDMIDENLSDLKRALLMLESSSESRCMVGVKMVPALFESDRLGCLDLILPKFRQIAFNNKFSNNCQETINECIIKILSSSLIPSRDFCFQFVDPLLNKLISSQNDNDENSLIWLELLLKIIGLLPGSLVKSAIFDVLLNKKMPGSERKREYLCVILGKCAAKLDETYIKNDLFPILLDLCNDARYEVRAAACNELPNVLRQIRIDSSHLYLRELYKFISDESILVKATCLQSLVNSIDIYDDIDIKNEILSKCQFLIDTGINLKDEVYMITITKSLVVLIRSSKSFMDHESKSYFVDLFTRLCKEQTLYLKRSVPETKYVWNKCKTYLAGCLPEIVQIVDLQTYKSKLAPCLSVLIKDIDDSVKKSAIEVLVDIASLLGPNYCHMIDTEFCNVLIDDSFEVLLVATKSLKEYCKMFKKKSSSGILAESPLTNFEFLLTRLLQLEQYISKTYKYDIHVNILETYALLPWLVGTDDLVEKILPVLDERLQSRALPVCYAAIRSMITILRKVPRVNVRNEYYLKLLDFSTHQNCYKRKMFIEICKIVHELCSKAFFKNWFYENLMNLSHDSVSNVRLAFLQMLPHLKRLWTIYDRDRLEYIEKVIDDLCQDKDKDVSELADKMSMRLDVRKPYYNWTEEDERFDRSKEEEEVFLVEMETKKVRTASRINTRSSLPPQLIKQSLLENAGKSKPKTLAASKSGSNLLALSQTQTNSKKQGRTSSKDPKDRKSNIAIYTEEKQKAQQVGRRDSFGQDKNESFNGNSSSTSQRSKSKRKT